MTSGKKLWFFPRERSCTGTKFLRMDLSMRWVCWLNDMTSSQCSACLKNFRMLTDLKPFWQCLTAAWLPSSTTLNQTNFLVLKAVAEVGNSVKEQALHTSNCCLTFRVSCAEAEWRCRKQGYGKSGSRPCTSYRVVGQCCSPIVFGYVSVSVPQ